VNSEDATVFTLRSGIDFLFRTPKRETYDQVNVMIVGTSDGKLQLSIYDSFIIGTFPQPLLDSPAPGLSNTMHMIHHAAHPQVSTHSLIYAKKQNEPQELHFVPMDLPFLSFSPINLSLLSSKLTTLQALLRYLKQISLHMQVEWKNARELPARFLRSVQGDLEEMNNGPREIVSALFHTAMTGHAYPSVKEWLVDSLAERVCKHLILSFTSSIHKLIYNFRATSAGTKRSYLASKVSAASSISISFQLLSAAPSSLAASVAWLASTATAKTSACPSPISTASSISSAVSP
jgi:hypothetical protein